MQTIKVTYDIFSDDWYKKVEEFVLGDYKFNEEQKKFIHYFESSVIKAGPGSGKTTALSAKVALLLKKIEEEGSLAGICVITHTNAAVNEVLKVLKKLGYNDIPHPHFIGTIHEFFNKYGMYPFLKGTNKNMVDIQFTEDTTLGNYFKVMLGKKHQWLNNPEFTINANNVINRLMKSHLYFDKTGNLNSASFEKGAFDKYKDDYLFYKKESWKNGIFHVNDTFCFAQRYFMYESIKKRLQGRFTYLLMDEYQDVSPIALILLKQVFLGEGNIFQMIGDSNQHIAYSNPEVPTKAFKTYYLNQTNRFGDSIAKVLNKMFNDNLKATNSEKSMKPILCLYKNPKELSDLFTKLLIQSKVPFKHDQIAILVAARSHTQLLGQKLSKTSQKNKTSSFQMAQNMVYRVIAEKTNLHVQLIKKKLQKEYTSYQLKINTELLGFFRGTSDYNLIKESINSLLNALGEDSKVNITNAIFRELEKLKEIENNNIAKTATVTPVKTIHDLKGQTLIANMVFLNKNSHEEYGFLNGYTTLKHNENYNEISKRVVYVAMSRATTLLSIALHEDTYNSLTEESRMKLKEDFKIFRESKK